MCVSVCVCVKIPGLSFCTQFLRSAYQINCDLSFLFVCLFVCLFVGVYLEFWEMYNVIFKSGKIFLKENFLFFPQKLFFPILIVKPNLKNIFSNTFVDQKKNPREIMVSHDILTDKVIQMEIPNKIRLVLSTKNNL